MNIVVASDGSDDAYAGLKLAAEVLFEKKPPHQITVTVIGWPPRLSPIWEKALSARAAFDDLHRAMALVADAELQRLRLIFEHAGAVESYYGEGDPATEIAALVGRTKADLLVVGVTRSRHSDAVHSVVREALHHVACPVFVAHGPAPAH
jgi:nucleotide-binding universal stress UspA family protein